MNCQDCKTCVSAVKNGHFDCVGYFKKTKRGIEAAARENQREIYNFLKSSGCPRSFEKEIHFCAKNHWNDEFYSFFQYQESNLSVTREMTYAALKYGDIGMLRNVVCTLPRTFRDAFSDIVHMHDVIEKTIKRGHCQMIEFIYTVFRYGYQPWSPKDFEHAISTGNINVLIKVVHMWKQTPAGLTGVENTIKLATIKNNQIDMLKFLDREIRGYPEEMMNRLETTPGKSTRARKEMIEYVRVSSAPVQEKATNLQKALAVIEDCDIPEGKYLELCNLLMDVHRRGVTA